MARRASRIEKTTDIALKGPIACTPLRRSGMGNEWGTPQGGPLVTRGNTLTFLSHG